MTKERQVLTREDVLETIVSIDAPGRGGAHSHKEARGTDSRLLTSVHSEGTCNKPQRGQLAHVFVVVIQLDQAPHWYSMSHTFNVKEKDDDDEEFVYYK